MNQYLGALTDLGMTGSSGGLGDMLRKQQLDDEEERRKKGLRLSQPGAASYAAGMGQAVRDLMGGFGG